jgi:hypothetical protein
MTTRRLALEKMGAMTAGFLFSAKLRRHLVMGVEKEEVHEYS